MYKKLMYVNKIKCLYIYSNFIKELRSIKYITEIYIYYCVFCIHK